MSYRRKFELIIFGSPANRCAQDRRRASISDGGKKLFHNMFYNPLWIPLSVHYVCVRANFYFYRRVDLQVVFLINLHQTLLIWVSLVS